MRDRHLQQPLAMPSLQAKEETRESWYGVQDPKKRKQIQDRLAQRARRTPNLPLCFGIAAACANQQSR